MLSRDRIVEMLKIIEVLYIPREHSDYVERLNTFLNPTNNPGITTAMWNKNVVVAKVVTKFYRPLTVFDYDEKNTFQKCFSYSSPDSSTKKHDLKYYILENKTKINVNAPILIPTKYLTIIKFKHEINLANNKNVENWLIETQKDFILVKKNATDILYQYQCVKYNSDHKHKFDPWELQKAHDKMINETKVEQFCKQELGLIKQKVK